MTLTAAPAPVEVRAPAWAPAVQRAVPTIATGAVLLWWGTGLVRASGGRDKNALAIVLLLLAVALVATRAWRLVPLPVVVLSAVLAGAALAVLASGGVGRAGAVAAGAYVLAGALVVVLGAWVSSADRAAVVAAAVCFAGLAEVCWAFPAWWAGGTSTPGAMVGTFFWWNPYAIYLLAPALLGLALAVDGDRRWRAVGWLTTPFAVSALVFSTSRASLACLGVGWLLVGGTLAATAARRVRVLARVGALTGLSIVAMYALTSPLVFPHGASPLGATVSRHAAGQTVGSDGGYRLDFWRQAVSAFWNHPATGTGYGRMLSGPKSSDAAAYSPLAHNGLLQGLAEGGLLLAVPLSLALIGSALLLLLALRHPRRWAGVPFVAGVVGLGLLAHGLVDFDWTFPSDVGALAICVALAAAPRWHRPDRPVATSSRDVVAGVLLIAAVLISGGLALGQHFEIIHVDARPQPGAMS